MGLGSVLFSLFFLCSRMVVADTCDYYNLGNCINVQSEGSQSFEFKPLFPENPTLVYAIDELTSTEIQIETDKDPLWQPDEAQRISFWLEYPVINTTNEAFTLSQIGMLFTNVTGELGGGNNGCDGILGQQCAENLKDVLKWMLLEEVDGSSEDEKVLHNVLSELESRPLYNLSCPHDIFDDSALTLEKALAVEAVYDDTGYTFEPEFLPSGNSSFTYTTPVDRERSYEEQVRKIGVGIVVRFPITLEPEYDPTSEQYEGGRNTTLDGIQLELVCVRAEDNNSGDGAGGDTAGEEENNENLATLTRTSLAGVLVAFMAALLTVYY
ncbi:hypothetical protein N7532_005658 [Penicillium argentinense]|uniref:Uncharacterized protein n=1 Tax=Penicillium argentinense TaxID=1131581 RepID=A0A9W9KB44_9EURO|nr:uncharacterized protein N7532_005658 [Penicillium argentinense]KAJ5098657.1 hypothetical protein N7532_005658 [Penicillium argentinense]